MSEACEKANIGVDGRREWRGQSRSERSTGESKQKKGNTKRRKGEVRKDLQNLLGGSQAKGIET